MEQLSTYIVFDLETTGLNPEQDQIIEIAAVKLEQKQITGEWHTLVRPTVALPAPIQQLTGINEAMVAAAPSIDAVLPQLLSFIGSDCYLVAHNAAFDIAFLQTALGHPVLLPVLDTLELSRILLPLLAHHNLAGLASNLGLVDQPSHRALADARTTAHLLLQLIQQVRSMQPGITSYWRHLLQKCPGIQARFIASLLPATSTGLQPIPIRSCDQLGWVEQTLRAENSDFQFEPQELHRFLMAGGTIDNILEHYQYRPPQDQMLQQVSAAIQSGQHLVIEAGTGTGKTLAYLLPLSLWAVNRGERAVVASYTINLQQQLWHHDLPLLRQLLPQLRIALLKGRSHYLCLRHWELLANDSEPTSDEVQLLARLVPWLAQTKTGDFDELPFPTDMLAGSYKLTANADTCTSNQCHWYQDCFLQRARREAEKAHLVIVNQALLIADLAIDYPVIPAYRYLVIDEAHHLEEVATSQLTVRLSQQQLLRPVDLLTPGDQGRSSAILSRLQHRLRRLLPELATAIHPMLEQTQMVAAAVRQAIEEFLAVLQVVMADCPPAKDSYQILPDTRQSPVWHSLSAAKSKLLDQILHLISLIDKLCLSISDTEQLELSVLELQASIEQCRELAAKLETFIDTPQADYVYWIERSRLQLCSAPIYIGDQLAAKLFDVKRSVVLTSATLASADDFSFFCHSSGLSRLPASSPTCVSLPSPFDYGRQAKLLIPNDLPLPGTCSETVYAGAITPLLADIVKACRGRTLILFTSHHLLRLCYYQMQTLLNNSGIQLLGHGIDGNRWQLIRQFQADPATVMMGTNSYWEGVDLPAGVLNCVVIIRLPFAVPDHPVVLARMEQLKKQSLNGFKHLSLPQAVLRFKQGFGRLIRSELHRGALVILDGRLLQRSYGKVFLAALPPMTRWIGPGRDLPITLNNWIINH